MIRTLAILTFVLGMVLADDLHQRKRRGEAESTLHQTQQLNDVMGRVQGACLTSLSSCRKLSDDLTTTGMQTVRVNFRPKPSPKLPAHRLVVAKVDPED